MGLCHEPARAQPFAREALARAEEVGDQVVLADALDAALASWWGPDDRDRRREWASLLDAAAAHLRDPDARLQAQLWGLTVAWEQLDPVRMHRSMRGIELVAEETTRARFFAASRRLPLELLRGRTDVAPVLVEAAERAAAETVIPDAFGVLHAMRAYTAYFSGDRDTCAVEAPVFEEYAATDGVATVRAEAAIIWLGAGRLDKVLEMVAVFTPEILAALPRDSDWLLTLQSILEGALALEDIELASSVEALLTPYTGRSVVNAGAVMWHGVTDDTLARAARLRGDHATADLRRSAALAAYDRIGDRWWSDRLCGELGNSAGPLANAAATVVHLHPQPGGLWFVGREGHQTTLPAMRGLVYLHALISQPDRGRSALDLAGGDRSVRQAGLELLDDRARRAYRARLAELDTELAAADAWADVGRSGRLSDEREALLAQLSGAAGLGGRRRASGSTDERARVAVRKAIVAAVARVAEADPWLGRHLRDRVRTGHECRYESGPDHPVRWVLEAASHFVPEATP